MSDWPMDREEAIMRPIRVVIRWDEGSVSVGRFHVG
jgi:hypothetical protein